MTDLEKFIDLYKQFGIDCIVTINSKGNNTIIFSDGRYEDGLNPTISDKFDGYAGFYSEITFDDNGKFITQGFWE